MSVAALLAAQAHRPFPLPTGAWIGHQSWYDLFLAHWPVPAEALQALLPAGLELDRFEGQAYVSVVAFRMENIRLRGVPKACSLMFPELNVRTYVRQGAITGVYFFSLDADNWLTVLLGQRLFGLPYRSAAMHMTKTQRTWSFDSRSRGLDAGFAATYTPGATLPAPQGSLPSWLMERYCFYSPHRGQLLRCHIHHSPWPVQAVDAHIDRNALAPPFALEGAPAFTHYSPGVDVLFWPAQEVA